MRDARFVGRDARTGRSYAKLLLREADYQPETVQFYRMVDIPFARALRQVSVDQPEPDALERSADGDRREAKIQVLKATTDGEVPRRARRRR